MTRLARLDPLALLTSGLGLFALSKGLIEANAHGWTSARILGSFAVAFVLLAAFVVLERRQRLPMLDLGDRRTPEAFVDGFSTSLTVAAGIALLGALVAATVVRVERRELHAAPAADAA